MGCVVLEYGAHNFGDPRKYGCEDWHHDAEGLVSYPWYKRKRDDNWDDGSFELPSREEQRWQEECSESAWDNLSYERNRHAYICEAFDEWERNERLYN